MLNHLESVNYTTEDGAQVERNADGSFKVGAFGKNSTMMNGKSQAVGNKTHAEGSETLAFENNAHAEGNATYAGGKHSHAEGNETAATGIDSHAEGYNTYSNAERSHAEGDGTKANGTASHAEGSNSTANGYAAHAEGYNTFASTYSHAEGLASKAEGENSHAEGNSVVASGTNSHAEGFGTKSKGESSHAEGINTKANGKGSHVEGNFVEAYGNYSHAEGNSNGKSYGGDDYSPESIQTAFMTTPFSMAYGQGSHVEGQTNLAIGNGAHAEGLQNIASGDGSHAEGRRTIASGTYQHVQGKYNQYEDENGEPLDLAHIVGGGTSNNDRKNIHTIDWEGNAEFTGDVFGGKAETELTIGNTLNLNRGEATIADYGLEIIIYFEYMDKFNAVKEMELTINSVSYTIPKNKLIPTNMIHAPGLFDDEKGGFIYLYKVIDHYPDIDTDYINTNNIDIVATVVDGYNLNKNGNAEFAGTVNAKGLSIDGESINQLIVGKKISNGGEIFNDYKNNVASGFCSHAEGYGTEVTNDYDHAEGYQTKASGLSSHAEGSASEAHGVGSHAEGRKTKSTGKYAHSEGLLVEAYGQASHAEGDSNNKSYSGTDYTSEAIINAFNTVPFSMAFGQGSHIEGQTNLATGQSSHAEGVKNIAKSDFSHVEGLRNISSGEYQHVQGKYNIEDTENKYAHIIGGGTSNTDRKNIHTIDWNGNAEFSGSVNATDFKVNGISINSGVGKSTENGGEIFNDYNNNQATGAKSHAEGVLTKATGECAHAEGGATWASGSWAHAEGYNAFAHGGCAHAEGKDTMVNGYCSHVEGYKTKASSSNQHVQGKFNIEDKENIYAHIVGGGTSNNDRKNIHTIDWNGIGWFSGGILLTTPDGTKKYKITIDNEGNLISSLFTEY